MKSFDEKLKTAIQPKIKASRDQVFQVMNMEISIRTQQGETHFKKYCFCLCMTRLLRYK